MRRHGLKTETIFKMGAPEGLLQLPEINLKAYWALGRLQMVRLYPMIADVAAANDLNHPVCAPQGRVAELCKSDRSACPASAWHLPRAVGQVSRLYLVFIGLPAASPSSADLNGK